MGLGLGLGLALGPVGIGGASAPTPLTILSDVVCWLRSDMGWTASQFTDQSGKGNHFVQAVPANQPTKVAADANFNGHDSWQGNGSSTFMNLATFTAGTGGDLFIWMVIRLMSASSFPTFFSDLSDLNELRASSATGKPNMLGNNASVSSVWGASVVGATKAVAGYDVAGGTPRIGVNVSNGTAVETTTTAHTVTVTGPVSLFSRSPGLSLWAPMKIAEMVVCTTMPTALQLAALQTYATTTAQGTGYGAV